MQARYTGPFKAARPPLSTTPQFFLARSGQESANGPPDPVEVDVFCTQEGFPLGFAGGTTCVAHLFRFGDPADRKLIKPNCFTFVEEKPPLSWD